ncbi:hypothetical protein MA16_Dca013471 [Dendrobium catenatum]|uniref:Uncharacterized protein n=1 Tax=Dendrobium catenatum TaxID=906689 RepID=A0A2I0WPT1_9ASPA|nr:hypothetical protein MA16_Dca013471 [Dendrobium catenatum]
MNADSVAGLDGFTIKFFQKTWPIIFNDVFSAVTDFFNGAPIPKFFTATSIILIPKNTDVNSWNDFRPISLCTVFYKLISKILMSRLTILLPISPYQMDFVKGRAIVDNILLAHELCQDLDAKVIFIIATDYLSRGLANLFSNYPSLYFKTLGGVHISHLCFADDFIIFSNAAKNMIAKILRFFGLFESMSGLSFNKHKCYFIASKNVLADRILNMRN